MKKRWEGGKRCRRGGNFQEREAFASLRRLFVKPDEGNGGLRPGQAKEKFTKEKRRGRG